MAIHPQVTVHPLCSVRNTLTEDLSLYAALGVRDIGLSSAKLTAHGWDDGVAAVRDAGLAVRYLVHGIYARAGDDEAWAAERDALLRCVATATDVGASCVTFSSGTPGPQSWEAAFDHLCRDLEPVVAEARRAGIALAIESSLSLRVEFSFLHSLADAIVVADALDIALNVDLYCCWVERNLATMVRDNVHRISMVQVSDYKVGTLIQPARWVPGDGDLPLVRLIDEVLDAGYTGPVDLEMLGPAIEDEGYASAIARGTAWLTATLDRHQGRPPVG